MSTPAALRDERIQPLIVLAVMLLYGAIREIKRELMFVFFRRVDVRSIYVLIASTEQHAASGMLGITMDFKGPLCCAFLGLSNVNLIPLLENTTDCISIDDSSETLRREASANKTAVLRARAGSGI